jgi:hypothetical protein
VVMDRVSFFRLWCENLLNSVQISRIAQTVQTDHIVSLLHKLFDYIMSDETSRTCHEYTH